MTVEATRRRFRFRWWMVPAGLGGIVVIVIAVGVIMLATQDAGVFRDLLTAEINEQTGRKVEIKGKFDLAVGLSPSLVAEDVTFANAAWGSRPDMIRARRLEVKVALFPMLDGRVETKRLVIDGADVLFETDKSGVSNWPTVSGNDDSDLLTTDIIEIRDSVVTLRNGRTGQTRTVQIDQAAGGFDPASNSFTFDAKGAYNQQPLETQATIGRRGPKTPLKLTLKAGEAELLLDGTVDQPNALTGLDVALTLSAPTLSSLSVFVGGGALPTEGPVSLKGRLTGGGTAYALDALTGEIGDTQVWGGLKVAVVENQTRLSGRLETPSIDLDRILGAPEKGKKAKSGRLFSDEPIDFSWLTGGDLDLDLALKAKSARYDGTPLTDLSTSVVIRNSVASFKPLAVKLAGGAFTGEARIDGTGKAPTMTMRGAARGIEFRELLAALDIDESGQGKVDIDADLRGAGASPRALAASLGGRLDFAMGKGRIDNGLIDLIAADLFQRLMPWNVGRGHANVNCMVARFPIERGVMRAERLLLDTSQMTMGGDGTIDLGRERMNLRLVPKPKDPSLFSLAVPVLIEGPLDNPSAAPDSEAVALGVAGSALGTLINPLGILIPFVSAGSGDENPCLAALKRPGKGATGAQAATSKTKKKPSKLGPVGDVAEGVGEGIGEGLGAIGKGLGGIFD